MRCGTLDHPDPDCFGRRRESPKTGQRIRHDNRRSGVTTETLSISACELALDVQARPRPCRWPGKVPAKWDAYSTNTELKSMRNFDPCLFVTVVGDRVYFGSSASDAAHCLDATTGEEVWTYYTDGPVRHSRPRYDNGYVYFGSDDGHVYCVNAAGRFEFVWKYKPVQQDRYHPGQRQADFDVSRAGAGCWCRTGSRISATRCCRGIRRILCALDIGAGPEGTHRSVYRKRQRKGMTIQGAMLASAGPALYSARPQQPHDCRPGRSGRRKGELSQSGGAYALLTDDSKFFAQHESQKEGHPARGGRATAAISWPPTRTRTASSCPRGWRISARRAS